MFIIETEDADGKAYWWDGDGWNTNGRNAKKYFQEVADRILERIKSVSFGAKSDNAEVKHA